MEAEGQGRHVVEHLENGHHCPKGSLLRARVGGPRFLAPLRNEHPSHVHKLHFKCRQKLVLSFLAPIQAHVKAACHTRS